MATRMICKSVVAAGIAGFMATVSNAAEEKIVIGVPAWPSAEVTANIISMTLEEKFGAKPELVQRGTLTILNQVGQDTIQIHPEVWLPNLETAMARLEAADATVHLSPKGVDAAQNICASRETLDQTGVGSVADLSKPEIAAQFDSDGDGKGEIWIGAPSWSSTAIEKVRAHSYGYDQTMTLLEMPEDVAMAAVDVAASLGRPIVFYCYAPHHVFKLHDVVKLEEPAYDAAKWKLADSNEDANWIENSMAATAWDQSHFHVGYSASVKKMPEIAGFLDSISFNADDIVNMSYAVEVERISPEEVARSWIEANSDRIGEWTK